DIVTLREKLAGFTGTGLAQAKRTEPVETTWSAGRRRVPRGSICGTGFRVIRPSLAAVSSPSLKAEAACAHSCTERESITGTNQSIAEKRVSTLPQHAARWDSS